MRTLGNVLVLIGLVAGLALAALLFQWDSGERAAAMATPTSEAGSSATTGTSAAGKTAGATAQAAGADSASGGAIQSGKVVYNKFCNGCHPNGKAGMGPAITSTSESATKTAIRQGKGQMPAFGEGQISEEQLADLLEYIKSLQ